VKRTRNPKKDKAGRSSTNDKGIKEKLEERMLIIELISLNLVTATQARGAIESERRGNHEKTRGKWGGRKKKEVGRRQTPWTGRFVEKGTQTGENERKELVTS